MTTSRDSTKTPSDAARLGTGSGMILAGLVVGRGLKLATRVAIGRLLGGAVVVALIAAAPWIATGLFDKPDESRHEPAADRPVRERAAQRATGPNGV